MSARIDAMTPGGYGETGPTMTHQNTGSGATSGGGWESWFQTMSGNVINRWMDVETARQAANLPPQYWNPNGQVIRSQYVDPQPRGIAGAMSSPVVLIGAGLLVLALALRK